MEESVKEILAVGKPSLVMHAMEPGMKLAKQLAEYFGLKYPFCTMSNKAKMAQLFDQHQVSVPRQINASTVDQVIKSGIMNKLPIITKQCIGSGCEGVYECNSIEQVEQVFSKMINTVSRKHNHATLLVQECVRGVECFVNTVTVSKQKNKIGRAHV